MPTLWQMLTKTAEVEEEATPLELEFHNPLKLKINDTVKIAAWSGDVDLSGIIFSVRQIREVKRVLDGDTFYFADYDLVGRTLDDEKICKRLRLIPMADPDADVTHNVMLLDKPFEFPHDQEYEDGLATDQNNNECYEAEWEATYWRPEGLIDHWDVELAYIRDTDGDGTVDEDEIKLSSMKYWDFHRETEQDGKTVIEWYLVEMNGDSGFFEVWVGTEINPTRVEV